LYRAFHFVNKVYKVCRRMFDSIQIGDKSSLPSRF